MLPQKTHEPRQNENKTVSRGSALLQFDNLIIAQFLVTVLLPLKLLYYITVTTHHSHWPLICHIYDIHHVYILLASFIILPVGLHYIILHSTYSWVHIALTLSATRQQPSLLKNWRITSSSANNYSGHFYSTISHQQQWAHHALQDQLKKMYTLKLQK